MGVKVEDVKNVVHKNVEGFEESLETDLNQLENKSISENTRNYFICENWYWDVWFQKLFAQFISVKLWIIALITILLCLGKITNIQFVSVLGIIVGFKGAFQVAAVWKEQRDAQNPMDKT